MSGFGRGSKPSHGGRGGSSSGGIAALRRGMPAKKNQLPLKNSSAPAKSITAAAAPAEESFQLSCAPQGTSQFAMVIRLTPGLLDDLRRVEAEGGSSTLKFGTYPTGHLIKVGQEEFKFSSAPEQGELCDIFEEHQGGDVGTLVSVGSAWRKLSVQRTLSASDKDRVKKLSVEAEQQLKSRKAIVLDSTSMKPEPPRPAENAGRRPPLKTKKEPPQKKRKVNTPAVPTKEKPSSASIPGTSFVLPEPAIPPSPPPPLPPPPPPQTQPLIPAPVEEIFVGSSPQTKLPVPRDKPPAVTTPETLIKTTTSGPLSMNDLRNNIILLLTSNPKGLTLKFLEKTLGDGVPQPGRKNIEKILKSIASYQPPGKYMLKPGVKQEHHSRPSPGSSSLPEAVVADSPESPGAAREPSDERMNPKPAATAPVEVERLDVERIEIDVGEENRSPERSPADEHKPEAMVSDESGNPDVEMSAPEGKGVEEGKSSGSGSSSSGSDSESESDSDSSSESGSGSGSDSSSSDSDEDEDVDIVSEDENHKQKGKAEKKRVEVERSASREVLHKESEEIDIGDAEDASKLDSAVERIIETIPLEVDWVASPEARDKSNIEEALEDRHEEELEEMELPRDDKEFAFKEQRTTPARRSPRDVLEPVPKAAERHLQVPKQHQQHQQVERRYEGDRHASEAHFDRHASEAHFDRHADRHAAEVQQQVESMRFDGDRRASEAHFDRHADRHAAEVQQQVESRRFDGDRRASEAHFDRHAPEAQPQVESRRYETDRHGFEFYTEQEMPRAPERAGRDEKRQSRDDGRATRDESRPGKEDSRKKRKWKEREAPEVRHKPASEIEARVAPELELGEFREATPEVPRREEAHRAPPRVEAERAQARKPEARVSNEEPKSRSKKPAPQQPPAAKMPPEKPVKVQGKGSSFETNPPTGEIKATGRKKNSSAEAKSKDSSGDSIQSKGVEFFAPYEKEVAELRGPIKSFDQYTDYCREFREKHPVYIQLNSSLEFDRENFENLHRDLELARSNNDQSRLVSINKKVTQDYLNCRKRFKRMVKTFFVLHEELRVIKERCQEFARQN